MHVRGFISDFGQAFLDLGQTSLDLSETGEDHAGRIARIGTQLERFDLLTKTAAGAAVIVVNDDKIREGSSRVHSDAHAYSRLYKASCDIVSSVRAVFVLMFVWMGTSARLHAQEFDHVEVQLIAKGLHFADGPVWSYDGFLIYSDVPVDRMHKWIPGTGDTEAGTEPGGAYGRAFDTDGRLYTCEFRERRVTRTDKKGKVEVLAARFEGKRLNAPNDIVVRRDGHVYFTDPAFGSQEDAKELDFYGVYSITPKGEIDAIGRWK